MIGDLLIAAIRADTPLLDEIRHAIVLSHTVAGTL